jgi:hypothetical protein
VRVRNKPFGSEVIKGLYIPVIADRYNYNMGAVDEFDHLVRTSETGA